MPWRRCEGPVGSGKQASLHSKALLTNRLSPPRWRPPPEYEDEGQVIERARVFAADVGTAIDEALELVSF